MTCSSSGVMPGLYPRLSKHCAFCPDARLRPGMTARVAVYETWSTSEYPLDHDRCKLHRS